jgi:predicted 3-demethylubiquinone-9 3-methyltransferase (glyoxalase superfamily)
MEKITTFLWFDQQADEAAKFYVSVFKDAKLGETRYYTEAGPRPEGSVLTVSFELFGREFVALNGGAHYQLTPAVSFMVACENQEEVDSCWNALSEGGTPLQCGWITDRFGVTWQITPKFLLECLNDTNSKRQARVMRAMMGMVKLDIAALERAYEGE